MALREQFSAAPPIWTDLDRGADSVVAVNDGRTLVKKTYFHLPEFAAESILKTYSDTAFMASQEAYHCPAQRTVAGKRFVLRDVVPVTAIGYDEDENKWSTISPYISGPQLSAALYNPELFEMQIDELPVDEQMALRDLQWQLRQKHSMFADGLTKILKESGARFSRVLRNPGIDLIALNTKLRHYPGEDFTRLVITDISPSVFRVSDRSYRPA